MKTTPEKIAEWEKVAAYLKHAAERQITPWAFAKLIAASEAIPALIADLEEARGMAVALAPDALRETEERKNIAAGLEAVWQGRMQDAETAHQAELAATRKQLAEAQALIKRLSPLMISAGYVRTNAEIQRALQNMRADLVKLSTPTLDATIAAAIADGRAKRLEALREWIAATGAISTEGSWYFELESIVAGESE